MNGFKSRILFSCVLCTAYTVAAYAQPSAQPLPVYEQPFPPEKNPPGDIPDNQVFITYGSPLGFSVKVPEGWARRELTDGAQFSDKYNTIVLLRSKLSRPITVSAIKSIEIPRLQASGKAVRVSRVKEERLPSGKTGAVYFASNSAPNPVTNKAIRLENVRYYFWARGALVTLTMSAPYGADNADQWRFMAHSFRWR